MAKTTALRKATYAAKSLEKYAVQKVDLPDLTSLTMEATAAEVEEKNSQEAYEKFNVDT